MRDVVDLASPLDSWSSANVSDSVAWTTEDTSWTARSRAWVPLLAGSATGHLLHATRPHESVP